MGRRVWMPPFNPSESLWNEIANCCIGYPQNLIIYFSGDARFTWMAFWKATALFQFGLAVVWVVPTLYNNANQPDYNIRLLQAVGGKCPRSIKCHVLYTFTITTMPPNPL